MRHVRNSTVSNRHVVFSPNPPNNMALVLVNDVRTPILIDSVTGPRGDPKLSGRLLNFSSDLFEYPYPSRTLDIGIFKLGSHSVSDVSPVCKCVYFPDENRYIVIPFACSDAF